MDVRREAIEIASPLLDELGFELVDVDFVQASGRWILRLFIDKAGGVTIQDCSLISKRVGDTLEMNQTVAHRFVLEVSSPGIERRLRTAEHFARFRGSRVFVQVHDLVEGRRRAEGELLDSDGATVTLALENGGRWTVPIDAVHKAHLVVDPWAESRAAHGDRSGGQASGSNDAKERT